MFKNHLKRMLAFTVVIGLAGWLYALSLPKIYEASVDLRAGAPPTSLDPNLPPELSRRAGELLLANLDTDVGFIKTQKIFSDGLKKASDDLRKPELFSPGNLVALFPMYEVNVPGALNQYQASNQRIIQVRVRAYTPDDAAAVANGVGFAFTNYRRESAQAAVADLTAGLRKQVQIAKADANKLDRQYQTLKEKNNVPDIQARNQALVSSVENLRGRRAEAAAAMAGSIAQAAEYRAKLASGTVPKTINGSSTQVPDSQLDIAKGEVARARDDYETLRLQFQDDAIQVLDAKRKFDRAFGRQRDAEARQAKTLAGQTQQPNPAYLELISGLNQSEAATQAQRSQVASFDAEIARRNVESVGAPRVEVELQRLNRDREIKNRQVVTLQTSLDSYESDVKNNAVQIIAQANAETIQNPVAPEVRRWAILSLFAGALLGLAYSFAVESLRLPVHTSWQLAELTALPVSAAVPAIPKPLARRHEAAIREGSFKPIESFRYMAFSLLARENRPRTVMFTGVGGDVGASSAAAEFAVATARTGAKTILVDCDLRSPQLSTLFGLAGRTGVSDVLGRTVLGGDSADLLVATEHEGLMILPAGTSTEAGLADFQSQHIEGLLSDLAARADVVVLDLPAVDIFSDAARMAHFMDEACLVVSAKTTSYRAVPMAQEILEKAGARSMSIVLTNASSNDEPFGTRVSDSLVRA